MLFEVLLAVLVLAVGITSALQAFSGIVQVTKRSRDLFEADFLVSDLSFRMFAVPANLTQMATGITTEYQNDALDLSTTFTYKSEMTDVMLPQTEEEAMAELPGVVKEDILSFSRNETVIANQNGELYTLATFHAIPNEE
jgi:Tfp pilus assembly protein PilV